MSTRPAYLSPREIAAILNVTPATIRNRINAGAFPGDRRLGVYRTHPDDFAAWERGEWRPKAQTPASEPPKLLHRRAAS